MNAVHINSAYVYRPATAPLPFPTSSHNHLEPTARCSHRFALARFYLVARSPRTNLTYFWLLKGTRCGARVGLIAHCQEQRGLVSNEPKWCVHLRDHQWRQCGLDMAFPNLGDPGN
ncbi:hypothetical protein J6590_073043 [Homalodisca vitripennis]|nr:hypothetical protein J6590_073043 [Homalodisca vitripennis]